MQQAGVEQRAHHEGHAAAGMEMVHIGLTVGVDLGQGRHDLGKVGHVLPGQLDAGGAGECRNMQGVVGRTAGGVERDHRIDDGLLVDHLAQRRVITGLMGQAGDLLRGFAGQRIAQRRVRVYERGARQVQTHDLHHHLIGVGGAVEGAGARAVVGLHFRFQQLLAARLAFGVALAHRGLFLVGDARWHRPTRYEDRRQMAEAQRTDHQPGDDLVADAEHQRGVEHVVRQRHRGAHGDHFATGQAHLHARLALGHAVAHCRHAAGELADRTDLAQRLADHLRKMLVGLMSRKHVVVCRHDRDVRRVHQAQALLVLSGIAAGDAMGEVGALQPASLRALAGSGDHHREVTLTRLAAALDQALGDFQNSRVHASLLLRNFVLRQP